MLGPGDVLVFPPRWAHYTESLGPETCASVTRRFKTPGFTDASDFADAFSHPTPRTLDWPEGVTPESLERGARFARWMERRGLVDVGYGDDDDVDVNGRRCSPEGRRALRLLETAGVVRPIGVPLRLDASGAVRPECCAMGKATSARRRAGGDGGAKGRGGAAQWGGAVVGGGDGRGDGGGGDVRMAIVSLRPRCSTRRSPRWSGCTRAGAWRGGKLVPG